MVYFVGVCSDESVTYISGGWCAPTLYLDNE